LVLVLKCRLPKPPSPPLASSVLLAVLQQLGHHLAGLGVGDDGAHRHAQHDVGAGRAELVGAAAGLAVLRLVAARVAVVDQGVDVAVGHRPDAAAAPAVAAVGAAEGDELLAPEAHAAGCHRAGGHVDRASSTNFMGGCGW
jgi:hypothetical protein